MSFDVAADAYDRFMGRYSRCSSPQMADLAGVRSRPARRSTSAAARARSRPSWSRGSAPGGVAAVDPSEPFVAAARDAQPGCRRAAGAGRAPAVPGRRVRRRPRPARRPFHDRSGRRLDRDGAGDAARRRRRRVRLGPRRRPGSARPVLAGRARARPRRRRRIASSRARARATWPSCSRPRGCATIEETTLSREPGAPELRGVVGAVHPRRRSGGRLRRRPRLGKAGPVARDLPWATAQRPVRDHGPSLGGPRPRVGRKTRCNPL